MGGSRAYVLASTAAHRLLSPLLARTSASYNVGGEATRAHLTDNGISRLGPLHGVRLGVVVVVQFV